VPAFGTDERAARDMELPPHLYGALCVTESGRETLKRSRGLDGSLRALFDGGGTPSQRRAALWALGHAGSSEGGYAWLLGEVRPTLLVELTQLALSSPYLSLRGTTLFALGLLGGSCAAARDALGLLGWAFPSRHAASVCLPSDPRRLLSLGPDDTLGDAAYAQIAAPPNGSPSEGGERGPEAAAAHAAADVPLLLEALAHLSDLSNHVPSSNERAHVALDKLRRDAPALMASPALFVHFHQALARCRVTLKDARFVHKLIEGAAEGFSVDSLDDATRAMRPS